MKKAFETFKSFVTVLEAPGKIAAGFAFISSMIGVSVGGLLKIPPLWRGAIIGFSFGLLLLFIKMLCVILLKQIRSKRVDHNVVSIPSPLAGIGHQVTIMGRADLNNALPSIEDRVRSAEEELCISGNDCAMAMSLVSVFEECLRRNRNLRIRIMMVDPESPASDMLHLIDPQFDKTANPFPRCANAVLERLDFLRDNERFEVRLLPLLPAYGFFITDPQLNGAIKIEVYSSKPWRSTESRPHFLIPENSGGWNRHFIGQFENYWKLSRPAPRARLSQSPSGSLL